MDQQDKMSFLANSIKQARAVMNKVDDNTGGPGSRTVSRKPLTEEELDSMLEPEQMLTEMPQQARQMQQFAAEPQYIPQQQYMQPAQQRNLAKSKMPPEILRSFSEMPAIDPTQPVGMELMMNEIAQKAAPKRQGQVINNTPVPQQQAQRQPVDEYATPQMDTKLIEYIIRKTVEETLEQVSKKTAISENIQIKIGDKTFTGKITSLNEIKKTTTKKA